MYEITTGILEKDWGEIEKKIKILKSFSKIIHIDILDGRLFSNTTFLDPQPFKKYSQDTFLELHMMVENPVEYLKPWAEAGFKRFIGHVEGIPDQMEFIKQARAFGDAGLALDGPTNLDAIKVPVEDLDVILCMSIESGFSGRPFTLEYLENKVKSIREKSKTVPIQVDGGINDQTILIAKHTGINRFNATSFIFKGNPEEQYRKLQQAINNF